MTRIPRILTGLTIGVLTTLSSTQAADTFTVDGAHSAVVYRVKHFNVAYFYGRFNDIGGTINVDANDPAQTKFDITVQAASIDSGNAKRDDHLKSPDFFNARQFPTLTFKSTKVKSLGSDKLEVTGDLSCHGKTKPMTILVEKTGAGASPRGGYLVGYETVFTIKRSEFGMDYMLGPLADEIKLMISLEGKRK